MIEYVFSSVALLVLSAAMLSTAAVTRRLAKRLFTAPILVDLIFFFVFVKMSLYYALPAVMRICSNFEFEREDRVHILDVVRLYAVELISWAAWSLALLAILRLFRGKGRRRLDLDDFLRLKRWESKVILLVLAAGFIAAQIVALTGGEGGLFLECFKSLFFYGGLATGPFLMVVSLKYYGKIMFALGVCASLLALLSLSTRGAIVYLLLFSLFLVWCVVRERRWKLFVLGACVAVCASYFALGGLFAGSIVIDDSGRLSVDLGVDAEKRESRSILEEIEWRFGASTRIGTAFLRLYDRGESAGLNPIKHSLMGYLPRSLDPEKPQPNTLHGDDIYSQGMYIIYGEIYGWDSTSMVEFPTGAHFYWEFGILGVLVLSVLSGIYVALCAQYFSKLGVVALPLLMAVFKPWGYVDPKIWISDVAMQIYQIILPLIVLVGVVRMMHGSGRRFRGFLRLVEAGGKLPSARDESAAG